MPSAWPPRARTSSTSAASRRGPGAEPVPADEELRRVMPVIERLGSWDRCRSRSTPPRRRWRARPPAPARCSSTTSRRCAGMPEWRRWWPSRGPMYASCTCTGSRGPCRTIRATRTSSSEVKAFLEERLGFAVAEGIAEERVWLDPGIGFGKTRRAQPGAAAAAGRDRGARPPGGRGRVPEAVHREPDGPAGGRTAWRAAWRPPCWHSSAEPPCSACTTWPRRGMRWRSRLLRWATPRASDRGVTTWRAGKDANRRSRRSTPPTPS